MQFVKAGRFLPVKANGEKLPPKVIQRCSTVEYQHATKDANFSAQERLDGRRRYVLSPHCLFREETFQASDKHDYRTYREKRNRIINFSGAPYMVLVVGRISTLTSLCYKAWLLSRRLSRILGSLRIDNFFQDDDFQ